MEEVLYNTVRDGRPMYGRMVVIGQCSMTLELSGCYDQLDLSALAGMNIGCETSQAYRREQGGWRSGGLRVCEVLCGVSQDGSSGGAFFGPPCRQQAAGRCQRYEGKAQTC